MTANATRWSAGTLGRSGTKVVQRVEDDGGGGFGPLHAEVAAGP